MKNATVVKMNSHANTNTTKLNMFEEDVYRELQKWERCASP
ncbi:hypothetical protein J2T15_000705 [Paenibacillus harenae]|uniref:Uncharacterized protein n=1 Tax=Paenibacillus harenae TaxID=306543 RepID=A0ABT9TV91_PAEHA|nr:hypothetical protein [Paenibacillus harenae]MDQ0111272.1 hypothetical protein [Paenibacillus harenae]